MNTEWIIGRAPGHCLCGMLTMGAKGQFPLHSNNCSRTQRLRSHTDRMGTSVTFICLCRAWKFGHWPTLFPEFLLEGGLSWTGRELCVLFLLSNLLFGGEIFKSRG